MSSVILQINNTTKEILIKKYINEGCSNCGHGGDTETPATYQRFYDRLFGAGRYTFRFGDSSEVSK